LGFFEPGAEVVDLRHPLLQLALSLVLQEARIIQAILLLLEGGLPGLQALEPLLIALAEFRHTLCLLFQQSAFVIELLSFYLSCSPLGS